MLRVSTRPLHRGEGVDLPHPRLRPRPKSSPSSSCRLEMTREEEGDLVLATVSLVVLLFHRIIIIIAGRREISRPLASEVDASVILHSIRHYNAQNISSELVVLSLTYINIGGTSIPAMESHVLLPRALCLLPAPAPGCSSASVARLLEHRVGVAAMSSRLEPGARLGAAEGTVRCGRIEVYSTLQENDVSS